MLHPVLYKNQFLIPENESWSTAHTWLHKQPLFLWQMAMSLKAFGINEFALRFPNMLAHGFLAVMIFDMGNLLKNQLTGIISSLTFSYLKFPLMYAAAMEATDHNDYMFLFYVTASFWALFNYSSNNKLIYLILIGIFAGGAVMVKWLGGFLVIGAWGSYCLLFERRSLMKPFISFLIACLVAAPWQLYCYFNYKAAFVKAMGFNARHISEALEGHEGDWWFHFSEWRTLYADTNLVYILIATCLLFFAFNSSISRFHRWIVLISILAVYCFFTVVKTKMPAFCAIVIPMVLLTVSSTIVDLHYKIPNEKIRKVLGVLIVSQLLVLFFWPSYFIKRHTLSFRPNEHQMLRSLHEKTIIQETGKHFENRKVVFINANDMAVKLMFYNDCDAVNYIPGRDLIVKLQQNNYEIVAFRGGLPEYILKDKSIIKL
ncbi:MAG: hypothetical protein K0S12_1647 [Bacteroidetes bacterium]|nr:hypothetical protein [Bacteroidota bacterium]